MDSNRSSSARRFTRRALVGSASLLPLAAQQSGPPPRETGQRVYLDYDQEELDAAYNQAAWAPNMQQIQRRYATNSEFARFRVGRAARFSYGPDDVEQLDIYRARGSGLPIHIFIHGGAWMGGLAEDFAFPAELFGGAGVHYIVPDFAWVQNAGGNLTVLAQQVRRAIVWVFRNASSIDGDANRIYLSAHSSGAHLAAVALAVDWRTETGVPRDVIKGALLISGIYDLKGPRLSSRNAYIKFDDAMENSLSPYRHVDKLSAPVTVAWASLDSPEFQRQSRDFAAAVKAAGKVVKTIRGENYNHFEFLETLGNPFGILGRAALAQISETKLLA
jgi:arylformamidase